MCFLNVTLKLNLHTLEYITAWLIKIKAAYDVQQADTVKPVYKDHSTDGMNVVSLDKQSFCLGTNVIGLYKQVGLYMEVVFNTGFAAF